MTHADLCRAAARWLAGTRGCGVVATEFVTATMSGEIPDAIGWKGGDWSILVECKTSRSDFAADLKKPFRGDGGYGMRRIGCGQERWYMTPPGLLSPDEIPVAWGLVEVHGKTCRVRKTPGNVPRDELVGNCSRFGGVLDPAVALAELPLLCSIARRAAIRAGVEVLNRKLLLADDDAPMGGTGVLL